MTRAAAFLFSLSIIVPTIPADSTEGQGPTRAEVEAAMGLPSDGDRVRGQMDTIVFDQFDAWHGPWGKIDIDSVREKLVASLRPESFVVDNAMHCREHSLEAILPFLQRGHPDRTIVPILVPHMGWDRLAELTDELAGAIAMIMQENGWQLGTDIAVVVSSDAVHYGPDFDHAPFGTDTGAYDRAVTRDLQLVDDRLSGRLDPARLHLFFETLVEPETLEYRIPWCGRFSIPFGLEVLRKLSIATEGETPAAFRRSLEFSILSSQFSMPSTRPRVRVEGWEFKIQN